MEGEAFKTDGKILIEPGWLAVYGKQAAGEDDQTVVPIAKDESAKTEALEIKENETKPPPASTKPRSFPRWRGPESWLMTKSSARL